MIYHVQSLPARLEDAADFPDDVLRVRGVVNHSPGKDIVETFRRKIEVLGVHLADVHLQIEMSSASLGHLHRPGRKVNRRDLRTRCRKEAGSHTRPTADFED